MREREILGFEPRMLAHKLHMAALCGGLSRIPTDSLSLSVARPYSLTGKPFSSSGHGWKGRGGKSHDSYPIIAHNFQMCNLHAKHVLERLAKLWTVVTVGR